MTPASRRRRRAPESGEDRWRTCKRYWWAIGLGVAALVVVVLAPLASADPDGLEAVAEDHGFIGTAQDALYSIIPDYTVPGIDDPVVSTILAGLIGVGVVFLAMVGLGRLLRRRTLALTGAVFPWISTATSPAPAGCMPPTRG